MGGKRTIFYLILSLLMALIFGSAEAQHARYIYIQSENNQPYYVKLNGANYSSNTSGYLLVPQLNSGDYTILLGFPRSMNEYAFKIQLGQDDRGFSLKQGVDNSWTLFDMVSFNIIKGTAATAKTEEKPADEPLATEEKPVVTEEKPVVKRKEQKAAESKNIVTTEIKQGAPVSTAGAAEKRPQAGSLIRKIYEKTGADGVDLVYVVPNGNKADTVILFVPHISK